jgi:hypothetical protein
LNILFLVLDIKEKGIEYGATFVKKNLSIFMNLPKNRLGKTVKIFIALPAFLALLSLLEVGFLPEPSLAQERFTIPPKERFKWGKIEIHPDVAFEVKYNDNIFLHAHQTFANGTREFPREDFIFTTSPSLIFQRKREKGDNFGFFIQYLGTDERFADLNEQNFYTQQLSADLKFGDVGGAMNWTLGGSALDTRNPISTEFASNLNPRQERTTYDLKGNLLWSIMNDIETDIGFKFSRNLFDNLDLQEFDQYNGIGSLIWQTTAQTGIGFNYTNRYIDFHEASTINFDSFMYSGSFILKWEPLSVFSSEFWIGFNQTNISGVEGQDREDMIYKVQLEYQPKITSSWTLTSFREIPNSYFNNIQTYQRTATQLTWNQKLGVKWESTSTVSFEINEYDIAAQDSSGGGEFKFRKDEYFYGSLSFTYTIQDWWDVIMEYSYTINDSNFDDNDYQRDVVYLRTSFAF